MRKILMVLPMLLIVCACSDTKKVVVGSDEILYVRCDARSGTYDIDDIAVGSARYSYVVNRELYFTYSKSEIVVYASFDYGYREKTHASIVDTYHGNVSWAISKGGTE